jgi:hypothetical protein
MVRISELMKETKESWVASEPENTDLAIYLHFWRGEEMIAMVQTPLDRDVGLEAGLIGAQGFAADTMSITFESYNSTLPKSPHTGKSWEPHEMQYTFEGVPENAEKHWVTECITTSGHERGGEFALTSMPYWIEDGKVVWQEEKNLSFTSGNEGDGGGGVMFEYMQNAMSLPTIEEVMAEKAKDNRLIGMISDLITDEEIRFFHTDMATYTSMRERKLVSAIMFTAEPGSVRAKLIEERLGPEAIRMGGE